jgi:hypothetical protein
VADKDDLAREIDANLEFFLTRLGELLEHHANRYALLRKKQVVGIYDTIRDAKTSGDELYPDGIFSIQKISDKSADLGVFSHAMHLGRAQ